MLVDPVAYVEKVENITVSEGGADLEQDESLAERVYLAPSSWSTAGPDDAYEYWVRTFDPAISDVSVYSDIPVRWIYALYWMAVSFRCNPYWTNWSDT